MGYGGIDEVEIDPDYDFFYVHRDNGDWNRYHISEEQGFLDFILNHDDDIDIYDLEYDEYDEQREQEQEEYYE